MPTVSFSILLVAALATYHAAPGFDSGVAKPVPSVQQRESVHQIGDEDEVLPNGFFYVVEFPTRYRRISVTGRDTVYLLPTPIVTSTQFASIELTVDSVSGGLPSLQIQMDGDGTVAFRRATTAWLDRKMALVVANKVVMAPTVRSMIPSGQVSVTSYDFSRRDLIELRRQMQSVR